MAKEMMNIETKYNQEIISQFMKQEKYQNRMSVPGITKVVVNMGLGAAKKNPKEVEEAVEELQLITGQRPVVTKARQSIAGFDLREGTQVGARVTLRGKRKYEFLEKLLNFVLPRVRDFRGISLNGFDGHGNYSLGLEDQMIFLEIDPNKAKRRRGLQVTIVTSADNDDAGKELLTALGAPFSEEEE